MSTKQLLDFERTLEGRSVLVTGHTGFTGGWLCLWLQSLGCRISGLSLPPANAPNLFDSLGVGTFVISTFGDIRDAGCVNRVISAARPEIVFHLAAQPLVSQAFADPLETFETNVIGTARLLEAARHAPEVKGFVCVTTDKVYADQARPWGYRETDSLGGKDPYSASKACAELVAATYQATLAARGNSMQIVTARGGNIIGGGDWSKDRIVPDFVRALETGQPLILRNPAAVRPWQHVMALVHGYLVLAARMLQNDLPSNLAWNFGPGGNDAVPVAKLIERMGPFGNLLKYASFQEVFQKPPFFTWTVPGLAENWVGIRRSASNRPCR